MRSLSPFSHGVLPSVTPVPVLFFYEDTSPIGPKAQPTPGRPLFNSICNSAICRQGHTLRFQEGYGFCGDTIQPSTLGLLAHLPCRLIFNFSSLLLGYLESGQPGPEPKLVRRVRLCFPKSSLAPEPVTVNWQVL